MLLQSYIKSRWARQSPDQPAGTAPPGPGPGWVAVAAWVAVLAVLLADASALTIRGGSAQDNARFYSGNDRNFQWEAYDWSGVGVASNGRWVTMVSDTYFLSANHYHPADDNTVTFWDSSAASFTYTVAGGQRIAGDIWLGQLTEPLDPDDGITTYPILMLDTLNDYLGLDVLMYGGGHYVGANEISATTTALTGYVDVLYAYDDPGVNYEAVVTSGDSGAPTFVPYGDSLALVGTHWYYYSVEGSPDPAGSGDPFLPSYADDIETAMVSESLTFVPEPVALPAFLLGMAVLAGRRQRRIGYGRRSHGPPSRCATESMETGRRSDEV